MARATAPATFYAQGDLAATGPDADGYADVQGGPYRIELYNGTIVGDGTLYLDGTSLLGYYASTINMPVVNRGTAAVIDDLTLGAGFDNQPGARLIGGWNGSVRGTGPVTNEPGGVVEFGNPAWPPDFTLAVQLVNAGLVQVEHGNLYTTGGAGITNLAGATFDDEVDGTIGGINDCPVFSNDCTFVKSGGTGTTLLDMQLFNSGTVEIQQGTLDIHCGYVQVVSTGSGGSSSSGTITGNFTGDQSVSNGGEWNSSDQTTLTNYTQTASGTLVEQIGGLTPGTGYGQIVVNGNVTLDGCSRAIPGVSAAKRGSGLISESELPGWHPSCVTHVDRLEPPGNRKPADSSDRANGLTARQLNVPEAGRAHVHELPTVRVEEQCEWLRMLCS